MSRISPLLLLICLLGSEVALADGGYLTGWLPPRPKIEHYQDRDAFVADILRWQRERDALSARAARGELPPLPADSGAEHDPADWHTITGPEDLETAVRNAYGYEQPHYAEPLRFNRTTHISFPLESLPSEAMADKVIDGVLNEGNSKRRAGEPTGTLLEDLDEITRLPATLAEPLLPALTHSGAR
jgi:hypothetical protein